MPRAISRDVGYWRQSAAIPRPFLAALAAKAWGWWTPVVMLYCYIMAHHHHAGAAHPSPILSPSLLRLSASKRLALAGVLIALIWAVVLWASL
jgi:hypothetical protein